MVLVSCEPITLIGCIEVVMAFLQAERACETLLCSEEPMTTTDCIIALFGQGEDHLPGIPTHPHATLWPSAVVTLGLLHALQGVSNRAFYRWLKNDTRACFR